MKKSQVAAAVALALSSVSFAQQAAQWKVSEGGNGHWYQIIRTQIGISWSEASQRAYGRGGYLATPRSAEENQHIYLLSGPASSWLSRNGPWLGGYYDGVTWRWQTGEPWGWGNWYPGEPNYVCAGQQKLQYIEFSALWNDAPDSGFCDSGAGGVWSYAIEWSADCNNDGIVDYGQCRDGSLPDYNGNNIPDCCESGTACIVGNYPVQWRVEDGGNGHWYVRVPRTTQSWVELLMAARMMGGDLASIASASENAFVRSVAFVAGGSTGHAAIGAESPGGTCAVPWQWTDGTQFVYSNWDTDQPNCIMPWMEEVVLMYASGTWHDYPRTGYVGEWTSAVVEWSADCNDDGIVDYGQILAGQLADSNSNGAPDACEAVTCRDADFFPDRNVNGADLGLLLSQWGDANQYTVADLNRDGTVDGADLGVFLSFWGPCAY